MGPTWRHLVRRFFSTSVAGPLTPTERSALTLWLPNPAWIAMFEQQSRIDQRHGFACGAAVASVEPARLDLIQAAVLHDIGKRHAGFGIVRRTMAGLANKLKVPLGGAFALYTAHGRLGAEELATSGAPDNVVMFTREHHGTCPPGFPDEDWRLLIRVDEEQ